MVQASEPPKSGELRDILDELGNPPSSLSKKIIQTAKNLHMHDIAQEFHDRKNRRAIPHRLERVGYVSVRNPDAKDGLFKVAGRRVSVYGRELDSVADHIRAARESSR